MLILVLNQRKVRVCFLPIFVPKILARKPALFIHETVTSNFYEHMEKYLYDGLIVRLAEKFTRRIEEIESDFNFELGDEFEFAICDILQNMLPDKFGVARGFVVNKNGEKKGDDIIIYDRNRFPTLRFHDKNQFHRLENIPIEAVYAYIEAKHSIEYNSSDKKNTFFKAFKQSSEAK